MPPEPDVQPPRLSGLGRAVAACSTDRAFMRKLRGLYRRADRAVARAGCVCMGGGTCCRFDLAAHRLFVTTGELAMLARAEPSDMSRCARGRCPYQRSTRCTARDVRPLGCRMFFCRAAPDANSAVYETYHAELRRLHGAHGLPYRYVELTAGLAQLFGFFPLTCRYTQPTIGRVAGAGSRFAEQHGRTPRAAITAGARAGKTISEVDLYEQVQHSARDRDSFAGVGRWLQPPDDGRDG